MLKQTSQFKAPAFKDHRQEREILVSRTVFAFIIVILLFVLLLARSWFLQIIEHENYQTRSNNNRISVQRVAPNRGLVFDRNGVLLAENKSVYSIQVIPEQVKNIDDLLDRIKALNLIEQKHLSRFKRKLRGTRRFKSVQLKTRLTEKDVAVFSANGHMLKGARIEAQLVRYYPFENILAHTLGFVGRINEKELKQIDTVNYRATRFIGKVGLEKHYEELLHGKIGSRTVEIDVQGRTIGKALDEDPPIPGTNIKLSIDINLQKAASAAMEEYRGAVVAINPRNGDVLALVSTPNYNPNSFVTGISTKDYAKLTGSNSQPLFNRALRGLYSPGSTIKPMLAWVGLENRIITTKTTINDPGYWVMPTKEQRIIRDWKPTGHGSHVDVSKAITQSCDPFFYDLAYKMGIDLISSEMFKFGFGRSTGIDMGEELKGIMPSREWKRVDRSLSWYPGDTVNVGIGQGYWNATPLQLANAVGLIATGESRFNLRLKTAIEDKDEWRSVEPILALEQPNFGDAKNLNHVRRAMEKVTLFPWGTAKTAFRGATYMSAGKTGTVQLIKIAEDEEYDKDAIDEKFHDNAVYIGYAPLKYPEIAIAVVIENGGHGGESAAPVARAVLDAYFEFQKKNKLLAEVQ
ncbi:MAG: penicillin-binding protein 2 [Kangiella sp.]|nr:MAG: penicillin-binding protein 2 [Kangiella sp.]